MPSILIVGIIIFLGFVFGEIVTKFKLPKVTGYILAGVLLNPSLLGFIPQDFVTHTDLITNIALSFITFSVGGTLLYPRIKKLGKGILSITFFEAEIAFLMVVGGVLCVLPFIIDHSGSWLTFFLPLSLLLGCLASPTDPSATLAVVHEYKARGDVSSTILGVAAFDDALGIINYSFSIVLAAALVLHSKFSVTSSLLQPLLTIFGSILLGVALGFIFNFLTLRLKQETEGSLIVIVFTFLALSFGIAKIIGVDELLTTMCMGAIVVNYNPRQTQIFKILERYTEQLIFIIFFTLSGMHLNFSVLSKTLYLVLFFVLFRIMGKFIGVFLGATVSKSKANIKRYTAGGLIPQGGIVVGLALLIRQNAAFTNISDIVVNVIIGATVINELLGPIAAEFALKKAGEIQRNA